jgi:hypothetical protein
VAGGESGESFLERGELASVVIVPGPCVLVVALTVEAADAFGPQLLYPAGFFSRLAGRYV